MTDTPPTRGDLVTDWLQQTGGYHPPSVIAAATGLTTHQAAQTCNYLMVQGRLERVRDAQRNRSVYGLPS